MKLEFKIVNSENRKDFINALNRLIEKTEKKDGDCFFQFSE